MKRRKRELDPSKAAADLKVPADDGDDDEGMELSEKTAKAQKTAARLKGKQSG